VRAYAVHDQRAQQEQQPALEVAEFAHSDQRFFRQALASTLPPAFSMAARAPFVTSNPAQIHFARCPRSVITLADSAAFAPRRLLQH